MIEAEERKMKERGERAKASEARKRAEDKAAPKH